MRLIAAAALLAGIAFAPRSANLKAAPGKITQGALLIRSESGPPQAECPLKHTAVEAEITGFIARVTVTQQFENTAEDTIEAVYVFPLPHGAAIDDMTIRVGDRTIRGSIKRREEARRLYEEARAAGRTAALLDQERPNIFTQSVANIPPKAAVKVVISYLERLPFEAGTYAFTFPMVVGPRYSPATVTDRAAIAPPVTAPGTRAGHDVSVAVKLDAGLPLDAVYSPSHDVDVVRSGSAKAAIRLRSHNTIPNKDFVLKYDAAGRTIRDTLLAHHDGRSGYFTLLLQPPEQVAMSEVTPKELVFVLDTSGSMSGFPIEKAKEAMNYALDALNPSDTFNLITFAGDTEILFPEPVQATRENLREAQQFLAGRSGRGGTEMMRAIRAALDPTDKRDHVRIVCFMTDGYVGNEAEILAEIKRHPNARIFSFGIGNSVNRYLLDKMAEEGRGEVEYVTLNSDGSAAAKRFHERVRNPLLTDIRVDWGGLPVSDLYPRRIPDLFSAKPLVISGRYSGAGAGTVRIEGKAAGKPFVRELRVDLPGVQPEHAVLAPLWARAKVDHLMHDNAGAAKEEIIQLGLDYRLMTPYTSFVAVDEKVVNEGGRMRRVEVPVEMPDGVSYEGVFGEARQFVSPSAMIHPMAVRESFMPRQDMADIVQRASKLHPALLQATGAVEVEITVTDRSQATLDALRRAGLVLAPLPAQANLVRGRIEVSKLRELVRVSAVQYIAPGAARPRFSR